MPGSRACWDQKRAFSTHAALREASIPPPVVVMILFPLKENTPSSPNVPAGRFRYVAPRASAASSSTKLGVFVGNAGIAGLLGPEARLFDPRGIAGSEHSAAGSGDDLVPVEREQDHHHY